MVHALRRAAGLLDTGGIVVDIHPTCEPAHLEVETGPSTLIRIADRLDDGSPGGPRARHRAADEAVATVTGPRAFTRTADTEFTFHTYADTVEELLAFLNAKWKQLHFADADLAHARERLRTGGRGVVVTERLSACVLTPG